MTPGPRRHKSASLRVAHPSGYDLSAEELERLREIISVKSECQGRGDAARLMYAVCDEADREWITLVLTVAPFGDGLTEEQLKRFYARFGFIEFQAEPCLMTRAPQRPRSLH